MRAATFIAAAVSADADHHRPSAVTDPRRRAPYTHAWSRWHAPVAALAPAFVVAVLALEAVFRAAPDDPVLLALAAAQSLPLAARHRAPRGVLGVTVLAMALQLLLGYPSTNAALGPYVAATAVATWLPRWRSVGPPAVCFAVWLGAAIVGGLSLSPPLVLIEAITALVAWGFADAVRRRRRVLAALSADVRRREREQMLIARTAALDERFRIGRDLHLVVGKALDAIVLQAGLARLLLASHPQAASREIGRIEQVGRQALAEMDRFLGLLRSGRAVTALPQIEVADGAEAPGQKPSPAWRVGVLVAPTLLLTPLAILEVLGGPIDRPDLQRTLLAFALLQTLPLLARHHLPIGVLVVVTVAAVTQLVAGLPVGNTVIAIPVAVHAAATLRAGYISAVAAGAVLAAVTIAALAGGAEQIWPLLIIIGSFCGVAWFIGHAERLATAYQRSLHERAARLDDERRLRVEETVAAERIQIARELHDSVGHTMSLAVLQAGAARMAADTGTAGAVQALQAIETAGRAALHDMERSTTLQPRTADEALAPPPRLQDLVSVVDRVRAAGVTVELTFSGRSVPLPLSLEGSAFRVVQEALTNVVKHAPGSRTRVGVRYTPRTLEVEVSNDRSGPTTDPPTTGGRGLVGMRERVELFDGELVYGPQPSGGYRVTARFPIPTADEVEQ